MKARMAAVAADDGPGRFVVTSPTAGVVTHVHAGSGEAIAAAAPVASVFEGDEYWARAQLPERLGDVLAVGGAVSADGLSAPGEIVGIDPEIDPTTRSLEVLVRLPEGGPWRLGRLASLSFDTLVDTGAVSVASSAIVRISRKEVLFVQTPAGFRPVEVSVITRSRRQALVRGAVRPGDLVAVSGLAALKNIAEGV